MHIRRLSLIAALKSTGVELSQATARYGERGRHATFRSDGKVFFLDHSLLAPRLSRTFSTSVFVTGPKFCSTLHVQRTLLCLVIKYFFRIDWVVLVALMLEGLVTGSGHNNARSYVSTASMSTSYASIHVHVD